MTHKVRVDIKFENIEQYLYIKSYLDTVNIHFDSFATFAVSDTWARMIEEYKKQLKLEAANADTKGESSAEASGPESSSDMGGAAGSQDDSAQA